MIHFAEFEAVDDLPSGLCACRLGDEPLHIAALSPKCIWLRTPDPIISGAPLTLYLYQPKRGNYEPHTLKNYKTGSVQRVNGAVLTRFCFDDSSCAAAIRRMFNDYARYLEIKSTDGPAAYAAFLNDYPYEVEDTFFPDLKSQQESWFSKLPPPPEIPDENSLAVELNCPERWRLFLKHPLNEFMQAYAQARNIPPEWLPARLPNRIYTGNAYCRHLFPAEDVLKRIAAKAESEHLQLTLVTAELRCGCEYAADRQIALAADLNAELVINDWGMLERAQNTPNRPELLLGTQLNRRRKDPRMSYKSGFAENINLLAQNSLNDEGWRGFLAEFGVSRYEYESCGLPADFPKGKCSLHLPFYQTNTSLWCPLQALIERGSRGAQLDSESCLQWCAGHVLLYPAQLNMLGRWNSIFALDTELNLPIGCDRWVLNF